MTATNTSFWQDSFLSFLTTDFIMAVFLDLIVPPLSQDPICKSNVNSSIHFRLRLIYKNPAKKALILRFP